MSPSRSPPSFLLPYLEKYPIQAGALLTTIYDLTLSVGWTDTRISELGGWVVLIGHKNKADPLRAVVPLPIHTTSLKPSSLKAIFSALKSTSLADVPGPFEKLAPTMDDLKAQIVQDQHPAKDIEVSTQPQDSTDDQSMPTEDADQDDEAKIDLDKETIYTSIVTPDSTVVYYKISKGIKKPSDIPDE
ncbi:uncharacterized protein I303_102045 [Kwoniella dejecticola CBS 10117]|uniref:tRNA-splicing endonuclease subunit Sen15 domain-containing protein n=1 Tax=Kwoniella dejecticola CBS 10117 TaxID=1296121 RepID=A0A1A6AC42_9TREE|nr:uncharacterized protein I303_01816 [Kwoniella dejecticola CBS 10117]OBR87608.1 hypothetical protein I303_01816 [Kwoniella dejecticola CBS 10117]